MRIIALSLSLRILLTGLPLPSDRYFLLIQFLHVPTWVLNDIFSMKYMKQRDSEFGVLHIGVLLQIAITIGMVLGSFAMSRILRIVDLSTALYMASLIPLFGLLLVKFAINDYKKV